MTEECAIAEVDNLISLQPFPPTRPRVTFNLNVSLSRVVDLTDQSRLEAVGLVDETVGDDDYTVYQAVGGAVAWLGFGGALVQSVRANGVNLVIYVNGMEPDDELELLEVA
jgi:hypothetical protein